MSICTERRRTRGLAFLRALSGLSIVACMACVSAPPPIQFQRAELPKFEERFPNWPIAPDRAAALLETARFEMVSERYAGGGLTGASRADLDFSDEAIQLTVKWKRVPPALDSINNSPRREIAAYQVQLLFLDPEDFVVPPSVARCLTAKELFKLGRDVKANVHGVSCELGILSLWLSNLNLPDPLFDSKRFAHDSVYAHYIANFNLLTYLIRHRDGRAGNFLIANDPDRPITYSIDNGVAFSGLFYNWFVPNWDRIRVPAIRRNSIKRLRALQPSDFQALGVVAQLEIDKQGIARSVPVGENLDSRHGARRRGRVIQFGLTRREIESLKERIEDLLQKVDDDKITLF